MDYHSECVQFVAAVPWDGNNTHRPRGITITIKHEFQLQFGNKLLNDPVSTTEDRTSQCSSSYGKPEAVKMMNISQLRVRDVPVYNRGLNILKDILVVFLSSFRQMLGLYFKTGHDSLLHRSPVIHLSFLI
jgi:hypothetical protein